MANRMECEMVIDPVKMWRRQMCGKGKGERKFGEEFK